MFKCITYLLFRAERLRQGNFSQAKRRVTSEHQPQAYFIFLFLHIQNYITKFLFSFIFRTYEWVSLSAFMFTQLKRNKEERETQLIQSRLYFFFFLLNTITLYVTFKDVLQFFTFRRQTKAAKKRMNVELKIFFCLWNSQ